MTLFIIADSSPASRWSGIARLDDCCPHKYATLSLSLLTLSSWLRRIYSLEGKKGEGLGTKFDVHSVVFTTNSMSIEQKLQYMADSGEGKPITTTTTLCVSHYHTGATLSIFLYLHKYYVHVVSVGRRDRYLRCENHIACGVRSSRCLPINQTG